MSSLNAAGPFNKTNPFLNYLTQLMRLHLKILIYLLGKMEYYLPVNLAVLLRNFKCFLAGDTGRFGYNHQMQLYFCENKGMLQYFFDRERGFIAYSKGIMSRSKDLYKSYLLNFLEPFHPDDMVIDCGANYGDLYRALENQVLPQNYIAFEPGPDEFRCLKLNAPESRVFNHGLGNLNEMQRFFVYNIEGNADSSFIEPHKFNKIEQIEMKTLDKVVCELGLSRIRLIKIEAEGGEPEVLMGLEQSLDIVDFIAIDGGFERGVEEEETLSSCINWLLQRSFSVVAVNPGAMKALFVNNKRKSTSLRKIDI